MSQRDWRFFSIWAAMTVALVALRCSSEEELGFRTKYIRNYVPENTSIVSLKVDRAPKLDGTLNDPLWKQAGKTESAYVLFPSKTPAGRQSVAYFCHDDKALYITIDNEETELDQQQIDNKDIGFGDNVGVLFEVGDTRGRGARCKILGNRFRLFDAGHLAESRTRQGRLQMRLRPQPLDRSDGDSVFLVPRTRADGASRRTVGHQAGAFRQNARYGRIPHAHKLAAHQRGVRRRRRQQRQPLFSIRQHAGERRACAEERGDHELEVRRKNSMRRRSTGR